MHFKDSISSDGPWYTDVPIGHNILQVKLKALLSSADIDPTGKSNRHLSHVQFRSTSSSWRGLVIWAVKEFKHMREPPQSSSKSSVVFWLRKGKPMEGTWQPLKQRGSHLLKCNQMEKWLKTWLPVCSKLHKSSRWRAAQWTSQCSCENCFSSTHVITYHISAVFAFNR